MNNVSLFLLEQQTQAIDLFVSVKVERRVDVATTELIIIHTLIHFLLLYLLYTFEYRQFELFVFIIG